MKAKDLLNLKTGKPFSHAEGRVCIDYTDPVTNKVKERIAGKNHVYESFYCLDWKSVLNSISLHMTDYSGSLDTNFPFLLGTHVGYGEVNAGSSGTYRGAYNSANSFLAKQNGITSVSWKYQYDFTPSQVPSAVKSIGLTRQYQYANARSLIDLDNGIVPYKTWYCNALIANTTGCTVNGRYSYTCSSGVVTRTNLWLGTTTNIDISATVGTSGTMYCGYAPNTGYFYIANTSTKTIYVFTDEYVTYSTSYNYTNMYTSYWGPFYVYGTVAYTFYYSKTFVGKHDFGSNVTVSTLALAVDTAYSTRAVYAGYSSTYGNKIISFGRESYEASIIFDLASESIIGYTYNILYRPYYPTPIRYPLSSEYIFGMPMNGYYASNNDFITNAAFCIYKVPVDAPERPAGYGMTITYEVEVDF